MNDSDCISRFTKKNELIKSTHEQDDLWCGEGMYFWDSLGNANYWRFRLRKVKYFLNQNTDLKEEARKFKQKLDKLRNDDKRSDPYLQRYLEFYKISSTTIKCSLNNILDLTDRDEFRILKMFIEKLNLPPGDLYIGKAVDKFCEKNDYSVVKIHGRYDIISDYKIPKNKISFKVKTIYCIKKDSKIICENKIAPN